MEKRKISIAAWNVLGPMGSRSTPYGLMKEPDPDTCRKIGALLEHEDPDFAFFQEVPPLKFLENLDRKHFSEQISSRGEGYCRGIMFYRKDPAGACEIVPGDPRFPVAAGYVFKSAEGEELFRFLGIWNNPYPTSKDSQDAYFDNFASILEHFRSFCHDGQNLIIAGDTNLILHAGAYQGDADMLKKCAERREELDRKLKELDLPPVYSVADNADTLKFKGNGQWYRCDLLFVSDSLREGLTARLGPKDIYIDGLGSDHLPVFAEFFV